MTNEQLIEQFGSINTARTVTDYKIKRLTGLLTRSLSNTKRFYNKELKKWNKIKTYLS